MIGFLIRFVLLAVFVFVLISLYSRLKGGNGMGIFGKFFQKKAEQVNQDFKTLLMNTDFNTMTEAQVSVMEEALDKASDKLAEAKRSCDKEVTEAEQLEKMYQKKLKAAEHLEGKIAAEKDADKNAALEYSLLTLLAELEEMVPIIEQEKLEADEAQQDVVELTELVNTAADNLKGARKRLSGMQRELERAGIAKSKAEMRANNAAILAGIKKNTDSMSGIFNTLQSEIDKTQTQAESFKIKADKLKVTKTDEDPHIAAAMQEISGEPDVSKLSLSDRLSALQR